jgi:hypothetical protein
LREAPRQGRFPKALIYGSCAYVVAAGLVKRAPKLRGVNIKSLACSDRPRELIALSANAGPAFNGLRPSETYGAGHCLVSVESAPNKPSI